jgi:D-alanine-D-alanine ligase
MRAPASGVAGRALPAERVAVVFGGPSAEHDISIVSGTAIADALRDAGVVVEEVLVDLDGRWWWLPPDHRRGDRPPSAYDTPSVLGAVGPHRLGEAIDRLATLPGGVVFLALHGPFGEDGTIQGVLEGAGLPYTGSGVVASGVGMDKVLFKRIVGGAGLPVVDWLEVRDDDWEERREAVLAAMADLAHRAGDERLMVKPASLGSSVGATLAHTADERGPAVEVALRYDRRVLVEAYVAQARELEVAVLGNDPRRLEVYGPGEVFPGREFYDFEAKYRPGVSRTTPQADLPPAEAEATRRLAAQVYALVGAEGFARVDFLLGADGRLVVSEINTIPGFTPISLFPAMAMTGGYTFSSLCVRVVELAVERWRRIRRRRLSPSDLPRAALEGGQ